MASFVKITDGVLSLMQEEEGEEEGGPPPAAAARPGAPAECAPARCGAVGPGWTRGQIERPRGEKDMGGWMASVYTAEQQARLGVDEAGEPRADGARAEAPGAARAHASPHASPPLAAASGSYDEEEPEEEPPVIATSWSTSTLVLQPGGVVAVPLIVTERSRCSFSFSVPSADASIGFELSGADPWTPPLLKMQEVKGGGTIDVEGGVLHATLDNSAYMMRSVSVTVRRASARLARSSPSRQPLPGRVPARVDSLDA